MIFPDHIRGKDKDPSFSAKQFRTEDELASGCGRFSQRCL
jgi:hypothetical protein